MPVYQQPPNISQPVRGVLDAPEPFVAFKPKHRLDVWYTPLEVTPWKGQNNNKANISAETIYFQPVKYPDVYRGLEWRAWKAQNANKANVSAETIYFRNTPTTDNHVRQFDWVAWKAQNNNKANVSAEVIYFQSIKYPDVYRTPNPVQQLPRSVATLDQQPAAPVAVYIYSSPGSRVFFSSPDLSAWRQAVNKANINAEIFPLTPRQAGWLHQQAAPMFLRLRQAAVILPDQPPVEIFIYAAPASRAYFNPPDLLAWRATNKNKVELSDETIYFRNGPRVEQTYKGFEWQSWKAQNNNKANISGEIFPLSPRPAAWMYRQLTPLFTRLRQAGIILPDQPPVEIFVYAPPTSRAFYQPGDATLWKFLKGRLLSVRLLRSAHIYRTAASAINETQQRIMHYARRVINQTDDQSTQRTQDKETDDL